MDDDSATSVTAALATYRQLFPEALALLERSPEERERMGYGHTLLEILQQPATWLPTARQLEGRAGELAALLQDCRSVVLTGSGSSEYAGECLHLPLQHCLQVPVQTIGSGALLTSGAALLPHALPYLMVSFARSGDSPESVGALLVSRELQPGVRHLIVTCNKAGRLVSNFDGDPDVAVVVLDERTNDQSLVMTSSFTNMVLAATMLNFLDNPEGLLRVAHGLSSTCSDLLRQAFAAFPAFLHDPFDRVFYLGSPALLGAARESALKMTEMTAGRVVAVCETYLGLRHGPMSAVHSGSLVVCFLSADPLVRAYEMDVIRELKAKGLGMKTLLIGRDIPADLPGPDDLLLEHAGFDNDAFTSILYVVAGQVLALLRCLDEGLRPDAPSKDGVINRVVSDFRIYGPAAPATV